MQGHTPVRPNVDDGKNRSQPRKHSVRPDGAAPVDLRDAGKMGHLHDGFEPAGLHGQDLDLGLGDGHGVVGRIDVQGADLHGVLEVAAAQRPPDRRQAASLPDEGRQRLRDRRVRHGDPLAQPVEDGVRDLPAKAFRVRVTAPWKGQPAVLQVAIDGVAQFQHQPFQSGEMGAEPPLRQDAHRFVGSHRAAVAPPEAQLALHRGFGIRRWSGRDGLAHGRAISGVRGLPSRPIRRTSARHPQSGPGW
ncbi:hypothetical protein CHT98_30085 (plasmid) [Azospirillum brasilense]|uniref:Uncharacterized protein n=1 Tax=Azospirillum brasilense TaxID=192 RepID=A0A235H4C6_AZOBR|nr:hypothetical protein CHT98_30085 [Azospirillum brasilense]